MGYKNIMQKCLMCKNLWMKIAYLLGPPMIWSICQQMEGTVCVENPTV